MNEDEKEFEMIGPKLIHRELNCTPCQGHFELV